MNDWFILQLRCLKLHQHIWKLRDCIMLLAVMGSGNPSVSFPTGRIPESWFLEKILDSQNYKEHDVAQVMGFYILSSNWFSFSLNCVMLFLNEMRYCTLTGRSISTAISAGAALAFTSSILDAGGQTTRIDNGKEYYAYTTQKRPSASWCSPFDERSTTFWWR